MSDFKSYKVVLNSDHVLLERMRHNNTLDWSLCYSKRALDIHLARDTFKCLPEDIQADLASAAELLS